MAKWKLPPPRTLPWPLRRLETAAHGLDEQSDGQLVMWIDHAPLPGLTPDDLYWWFGNIAGDMDIAGIRQSRYLAWHPADHIHWALHRPGPNGLAEQGAVFHIVEAFGGDMRQLVDVKETVTRLDPTGITLESRLGGHLLTQLKHDFGLSKQGATYHSTLSVGLRSTPLKGLVNRLIQRFAFSPDMGRAWIRHNIEEVGLLEHLVPQALREG